MNKLGERLSELKRRHRKAFIAFVTAGDPTIQHTLDIAGILDEAGADVIELGLPFSDPIADGQTIQKAGERSLARGMNTDKYFRITETLSRKYDVPLVCLTYYNVILQYGVERFAESCRTFGVSGVIVPDVPVEESGELSKACGRNNVNLIFLVSETTTPERMDRILEKASGFVYVVALLGTTGARDTLSEKLGALVRRVKRKTKLPVAVGFGISKPEHAKKVIGYGADAVIVGSAIVKIIEENISNKRRMLDRIKSFAAAMRRACG
ncbi:MAG: tryptophan synthase subunit alpha [Candidatus Altiarchaeota archaeon]|nr:tryptophan synthase subunit alpha [Candidatus Altiarchaeota archaeon]